MHADWNGHTSPYIRWEIPDGATILLYGVPISLHAAESAHGLRSAIHGPPGSYALSYEIYLCEKLVGFVDEKGDRSSMWFDTFVTKEHEIELLSR
ncbi:MAG: hypothetical protein AB1486_05390 [Planctomycetota bacterium]